MVNFIASFFSPTQSLLLILALLLGILNFLGEEIIHFKKEKSQRIIEIWGMILGLSGLIIFSSVLFFERLPFFVNYLVIIITMALILIMTEVRQNSLKNKQGGGVNLRRAIDRFGIYQFFSGGILAISLLWLLKSILVSQLVNGKVWGSWILSIIITLLITIFLVNRFCRHPYPPEA